MMNLQIFIVSNHFQQDTLKTLNIGDQSEVPIEQNLAVVCYSSIEYCSRFPIISSAVADIK